MPLSRKVRLTLEANADLRDILYYTRKAWGEEQRRAYAARLDAVLGRLARFPEIGARRDKLSPGLLSHPAEHHLIIYRATDTELIVYRIVHRRRDLQEELGTLNP